MLPAWLVQVESEAQAWEAFQNGQSDLVTAWLSRYVEAVNQSGLDQLETDSEEQIFAEPIPSLTGDSYTLATGWVWAVASPDPEKRALAVELIQFLAAPDFLAEWNSASGFLPPRPDALAEWTVSFRGPAGNLYELVTDLSESASLKPSEDVLAVLGPPVRQAVMTVLNQQADPEAAARAAVASLNLP